MFVYFWKTISRFHSLFRKSLTRVFDVDSLTKHPRIVFRFVPSLNCHDYLAFALSIPLFLSSYETSLKFLPSGKPSLSLSSPSLFFFPFYFHSVWFSRKRKQKFTLKTVYSETRKRRRMKLMSRISFRSRNRVQQFSLGSQTTVPSDSMDHFNPERFNFYQTTF